MISGRLGDGAGRKVIAALLYVLGAIAVLFVAYQSRIAPSAFVGYMPLYAMGMALVATTLLWPKSSRPTPERRNESEDK
jgi:uncharacterized membrane protein